MRPEDIVFCTGQVFIVNVCHIVAGSFQNTAMSLRQVLVDLDLHAPTSGEGVKSSSPARSAA
jgi:hypothetical protein